MKVTQLSWFASTTRLLLHFADAPCHNRHYHNGVGDYHADTPYPSGKAPEDYVKHLAELRVDYYFVKINDITDRMTNVFSEALGEAGAKTVFELRSCDEPAVSFVPLVLETITESSKKSMTGTSHGSVVDTYESKMRSYGY